MFVVLSVCVCGLEVELCRAPAATISFHPRDTHNTLLMVTWLWVCLIGSESVGYRPRSGRLIAADCAFQRLMGLRTRVGNYCYAELLIIYSGVFTRVLCTTKQSMTGCPLNSVGRPAVMDSGLGPGGWCRLGESQQLDLYRGQRCAPPPEEYAVTVICKGFTLTAILLLEVIGWLYSWL